MSKRNNWKFTILWILVAALLVGMIVGFTKLADLETTETISPLTAYEVGGLDDTSGAEVENKAAIRMKNLQKIDGLTVKLAEKPTVSYKIFYYDENRAFLSTSSELSADTTSVSVSSAKYFKIVIYTADKSEVGALDVYNLAKQLTVTVNK